MQFQYWYEGLVFIGFFLFMVGFPCLMTGILGTRLIDDLGQWPSKSARFQMKTAIPLLFVQVFSFFMLALFFHIFS